MMDDTSGLPKYMIVPQDGGVLGPHELGEQSTDDPVAADKIVHDMARANPGKYVAVYQRVILIRKTA